MNRPRAGKKGSPGFTLKSARAKIDIVSSDEIAHYEMMFELEKNTDVKALDYIAKTLHDLGRSLIMGAERKASREQRDLVQLPDAKHSVESTVDSKAKRPVSDWLLGFASLVLGSSAGGAVQKLNDLRVLKYKGLALFSYDQYQVYIFLFLLSFLIWGLAQLVRNKSR